MDEPTTLHLVREGPLLWIELDRPDAMNAYTGTMGDEIRAAFQAADGDDAVRVVILTARGRMFCPGADISGGAASFDASNADGAFGAPDDDRPHFVEAIFECRKPTIVAFNGHAVGVGLTMALPADIRLSVPDAKFGCVFVRRGLLPEAGAAWFLTKIVGLAQALRWCLTGSLFSAQEALDKGLLSEMCEPGQLRDRAREIALEIAQNNSPVAVAVTRQMLWRFAGTELPYDAIATDRRLGIERGRSADVKEGVQAFVEKRVPDFPDRVSTDLPAGYPWWETQ